MNCSNGAGSQAVENVKKRREGGGVGLERKKLLQLRQGDCKQRETMGGTAKRVSLKRTTQKGK